MRGLRVVVAVQCDAPRTLPRQGKLAPSPCCKWSGAVPRVWEWSVGTLCGAAVAVRSAMAWSAFTDNGVAVEVGSGEYNFTVELDKATRR